MHAFLYTGKTQTDRTKEITGHITKLRVSDWDTVHMTPGEQSTGIDAVRVFARALSITARTSPSKVGVIADIHRLTTEAQNALLKILEEPPPHVYILAETATPDALLPTITSRCTIIDLGVQKDDETLRTMQDLVLSLPTLTPAKRFELSKQFASSKADALTFVDSALTAISRLLLQQKKTVSNEFLTILTRQLLRAKLQLLVNVQPQLVLDNIFLWLP